MSNNNIFKTNQEKTTKNFQSILNPNKKHNSVYNQTTQNSTTYNNTKTNKTKSKFIDFNDKTFCALVRQAFWEEEYLKNKTLIPNAQNYDKYLYVKKQLNKICKLNNTELYEEPQTTIAYFTLKLCSIDITEMQILSKITKLCSAVSIDANLNGELEIGVTIPDVRCVLKKEQ